MPEVMSIEVDEEFDPRPPAQPFGMRSPDGKLNIGLIAGIAVAVILVIALVIVIANPFGSKPKAPVVATFTPVDPLKYIKTIPLYAPNEKIVLDLQASLDAWAKFYTEGKIEKLQNTFDVAGKQYAQLLNGSPAVGSSPAVPSAAEILASPDAGLPAKVEINSAGNAGKQGTLYTVRADITWTKPGTDSISYKWDITMKKGANSNVYLLSTIKTTSNEAINTLSFCDAVKTVAKLQDDTELDSAFKKLTLEKRTEAIKASYEIRMKVWRFVETAFDESKAPDSVAIIVDQYDAVLKALDKSKNLTEFSELVKPIFDDEATIEAYGAIEDAVAAESDCSSIDISGR